MVKIFSIFLELLDEHFSFLFLMLSLICYSCEFYLHTIFIQLELKLALIFQHLITYLHQQFFNYCYYKFLNFPLQYQSFRQMVFFIRYNHYQLQFNFFIFISFIRKVVIHQHQFIKIFSQQQQLIIVVVLIFINLNFLSFFTLYFILLFIFLFILLAITMINIFTCLNLM